jgi:anti-anti-sigma regulatory factor
MLKITIQPHGARTIFELEGRLSGAWVGELETCWRQTVVPGQPATVVLKTVTFIDKAGIQLLAEMHGRGVELVADGCMTKAIIQEIVKGGRS